MENDLYRKILVPSTESYDAETATILYVTEENNCFAVWIESYFGINMLDWFPKYKGRETALEYAIDNWEHLRVIEKEKQAAKLKEVFGH